MSNSAILAKIWHFLAISTFLLHFDILVNFRRNFDRGIGFRALYNLIVHIEVHINTRGGQGSQNRGGFFFIASGFYFSVLVFFFQVTFQSVSLPFLNIQVKLDSLFDRSQQHTLKNG